MLEIPFTWQNFVGPLKIPQTASPLNVAWPEFLGHAATVGNTSYFAGGGGDPVRSLREILWRMAGIAAHMKVLNRRLVQTSEFERLDGSEKTAVTYSLGMTVASIMATHQLGATGLAHVDRVLKLLGAGLPRKSRPDLVGHTDNTAVLQRYSGRMLVEAKGTSQGFRQSSLEHALRQLGKQPGGTLSSDVLSLLGSIYLRAASIAYFQTDSHKYPTLHCHFEDPPIEDTNFLEYSDEQFHGAVLAAQFLPVAQAIRASVVDEVDEVHGFVIGSFNEVGIRFAVPTNLYALERRWAEVSEEKEMRLELAEETQRFVVEERSRESDFRGWEEWETSRLPTGIFVSTDNNIWRYE